MMSKKIAIIGAGNAGTTIASHLVAQGHTCVLHDVVDSQFTDLREPEPLMITKLPEFKEPWIDPKEPVFNQHKHNLTCAKNRKKRKKRKRR
jgi:3-hydroxyacyl-CoA dehydrogenase